MKRAAQMQIWSADAENKIIHGDCIELMNSLGEGSVDLAFADPPFNIGYDYDVYDDSRAPAIISTGRGTWISAVHRVLKPTGTFWLAIGDEYAAELKIASQEIGFQSRSWVMWYYTFGVNCKNKFSRSHAHLFYFVKDHSSSRSAPTSRKIASPRPANWSMPTRERTRPVACPTTPGFCARKTWPTALPRRKTRGISRAWRAHSKSGPASTAARCPSSFWAGSSAPARIPANSCSIPSAAARQHWPWRKNSAATIWGSTFRKNTSARGRERLASICVGDTLNGSPGADSSRAENRKWPTIGRTSSGHQTPATCSKAVGKDRCGRAESVEPLHLSQRGCLE